MSPARRCSRAACAMAVSGAGAGSCSIAAAMRAASSARGARRARHPRRPPSFQLPNIRPRAVCLIPAQALADSGLSSVRYSIQ
jgi:hypothetical protein